MTCLAQHDGVVASSAESRGCFSALAPSTSSARVPLVSSVYALLPSSCVGALLPVVVVCVGASVRRVASCRVLLVASRGGGGGGRLVTRRRTERGGEAAATGATKHDRPETTGGKKEVGQDERLQIG